MKMRRCKVSYIVICRGSPVRTIYVLATSRRFYSYSDAELYTQSIAASREPIIVQVEN
jgi:hypothetical protein